MNPEHDIRFLDCLNGVEVWPHQNLVVKSEALAPVASSFQVNYLRAVRPCLVIIDVIAWTSRNQMCVDSVYVELGIEAGTEESKVRSEEIRKRLREETQTSIALFDANPEFAALWSLKAAETNLGLLMQVPSVSGSLEVLLASMLINAWTAFETAAVDLWVAALNTLPKPLAIAAINNQAGGGDDRPSAKPEQKKSETLAFIQNLIEHDEAVQAGSFLKWHAKFQLDRYEGIKRAFRAAFGTDIESILGGDSFIRMHALDAIRNALVHAGGKVDAKFVRHARDHREAFVGLGMDNLGVGDTIRLNGDQVRIFLDSTSAAITSICLYVDTYLQDNE